MQDTKVKNCMKIRLQVDAATHTSNLFHINLIMKHDHLLDLNFGCLYVSCFPAQN